MRAAAAAVLCVSSTATAQTVRGIIVDQGDVPIPGVVVQLLDAASHVAARSLSNERGEFRVTATEAGTYRVSTLRIGYRQTVTEPIQLERGADVTRRMVLAGARVVLDTIRVSDRSVCRAFSDSGAATYAVWEQVRGALTATQLTAAARTFAATTVLYDRTLDAGARQIRQQNASIRSDYVTELWSAAAPSELHRVGYVVTDRQNMVTYYAPGLNMLLAPVFVEDHCFRLTNNRNRLGIIFEPTRDRRDVPEIRGTLWVDRATAELRDMEFRYVNLTREQEDVAGGNMTFARMHDGQWVISAWNIRMPVLEQRVRNGIAELVITEVKSTGAVLSVARRGTDTLWSRPPLFLAGTVVDSVSGDPVPGARVSLNGTSMTSTTDAKGRFTISGVLPGIYTVVIVTPSLDSVSAVQRSTLTFADSAQTIQLRALSAQEFMRSACGSARMEYPGMVSGTVDVRGDSSATPRIKVAAEWSAMDGDASRPQIQTLRRAVSTGVDARGHFKLCGVPVNTDLSIYAELGDATVSDVSPLRIPPHGRVARVDLSADVKTDRGSIFSGTVHVADSTNRPIARAVIALPDLVKTVMANDSGEFKLVGIPAGPHRVVVRSIGYAPLDTTLSFGLNQTIDRRVFLRRVVMLDSVVTRAARLASLEFEENRRLGLGSFFTREELEQQSGRLLSSILASTRGLGIVYGRGNRAYVLNKRYVPPPGACSPIRPDNAPQPKGSCYVPDAVEARYGIIPGCYTQVYLDDHLMNPGTPAEPFDLNTMQVDQLENVQFYAGPAETPAKYSGLNSPCGVLVFQTRRYRPE